MADGNSNDNQPGTPDDTPHNTNRTGSAGGDAGDRVIATATRGRNWNGTTAGLEEAGGGGARNQNSVFGLFGQFGVTGVNGRALDIGFNIRPRPVEVFPTTPGPVPATGASIVTSQASSSVTLGEAQVTQSSGVEGEPPCKRKAEEQPTFRPYSGVGAFQLTVNGTSLESISHTTTHDLRDPTPVTEMLENVLKPFVIECNSDENTNCDLQWKISDRRIKDLPVLTVVLNLEVSSLPCAPVVGALQGAGDTNENMPTVLETVNHLENELFNGRDVTLNVTIRVNEPAASNISAAEYNNRVAERKEAKESVYRIGNSGNAKLTLALLRFYYQYLYLKDKMGPD